MILFNRRRRLLFAILFVAVLILEEVYYSKLQIAWHSYYKEVVYRPISVKRDVSGRLPIAVAIIVEKASHLDYYETAQNTVECYCKHFGYPLLRIVVDDVPEIGAKCSQTDFMFRRHCILAELLRQNPSFEYVLFLDADMGIINPNHLIEEYINPLDDVTFYERVFNFEVMAGSYIVRNSEKGRTFLTTWANYEYRVPNSFHGTDNAALHQVLVDQFAENDSISRNSTCRSIWEKSRDWDGVWSYVACARSILHDRLIFPGISIRPKVSQRVWARDGWLTNSLWSDKDFIFHGWQTRRLNKPGFGPFWYPFGGGFDLAKCSTSKVSENWPYKDTFMTTDDVIEYHLREKAAKVRQMYDKAVDQLSV
uniref:Glycosyltransferase family 6 protein n=1 Tax=Panagrellus redivivus TaxID=6233 RepID=A0A7E4VB46_PANRE